MTGYDRWRLREPPEAPVVGTCLHCQEEILAGDMVYPVTEGRVHETCFVAFAADLLCIGPKQEALQPDREVV